MRPPHKALGEAEFIGLTAFLMAMVAMSIDSMLPALGLIAHELGANHPNDRQLILALLFAGLSVGQFFYGPLSDAIGRRKALLIGLCFYMVGAVLCTFAQSFEWLLVARFVQGFGAAGPRIVAVAMVRDTHEGRAMARIMSFAMSIFILVPVLAPSIGQVVLLFGNWRMIFAGLSLMGLIGLIWSMTRQGETLAREKRVALRFGNLWHALTYVLSHRVSLGYILATGFIFGGFIGYLNSTQQILGEAYGLGAQFPLYFGLLAAGFGVASLLNARLVMRLGMHYLSLRAGILMVVISLCLLGFELTFSSLPPLWYLMASLMGVFFCAGVLFGNYNTLAMEPMGHIAGAAAAIIGSATTGVSLIIGTWIGRAYDGTPLNISIGFVLCGLGALLSQAFAEKGRLPKIT